MGTKTDQVKKIDLAKQKEKLEKIIAEGFSATDVEAIRTPEQSSDNIDAAVENLLGSIASIRLQNQGLRRTLAIMAQRKIEMGTYFDCSTCRGPIDPNRLLKTPEANTCITCESDPEHGDRDKDEATGD